VIHDFKNLFRFQNFYLGGQPTLETLQWMKSHGVSKIVNLRSERENNDFSGTAFDEAKIIRDLGIEYHSVPVDGIKDYTPEKLDSFAMQLNTHETILIHCYIGVRATDFFMAYLVKSRGYSVNRATEIGRNLKFSMPLEKLLDEKIRIEIEK